MHNHLEKRWAEIGVERMTLHATGVGAYAWATMQYELDPHFSKQETLPAAVHDQRQQVMARLRGRAQQAIRVPNPINHER